MAAPRSSKPTVCLTSRYAKTAKSYKSAYAVTKFKGVLYVGGGQLGLFRRVGTTGELELFKPKIDATHFDSRENLVITCDAKIAGTMDNISFFSVGKNALCQYTADRDIIQWDDHI